MKEIFKRIAALLLATALVIGFFPALTRAETTATEISSLEEITDLAGSYILTGDITVTAPIGSSTTPFTGSFDGNGKTITVNITATANYAGIFAAIGVGATVSNFKIVDSSIATTGNYSYMGLVAGSCAGTISNVVVENSSVQGYAFLGGIVGFLDTTGTITACTVESGKVEKSVAYNSDSYYGGIVGDSKGTISLCSNGASVINTSGSANRGYFGGIVGRNAGTVTDCYNFGVVDTSFTKAYRTAGVAGHNDGTVTNCHNVGIITVESSTLASAKAAVACLKTWGTIGTIANCYYADSCGVTDTKATSKTDLEFKALASALGENWADGNTGYPVLTWQTWKIGGGSTEPTEGSYTVEHYTENLDGEGYTLATSTAGDTPAGETATAEATDLEGFTFDETNENNVTTGTVTEDGSLVLKLYYFRNSYTLTWDVADGTITSEEGTYTAGSVKYEAPITAPTATAAGREFSAWSPAIETMPAQDLTITAVWTAKFYDVHWDANGGELSTDLWTGQYGVTAGAQYGQPLNKYTYSEDRPTWIFTRSLPDPEHATHVFDGWWTAAEGGELVTGDMVIAEPDNGEYFTFYAHWLESYTVTLDPGEGSLTTKTYLVAKGQAFGTAVGSMPVASQYAYHHFNSWIDANGEKLTMDTVINGDVTYYATWNPNTAKVVFYANGGEGTMEDQIITYGDDQPLTKCAFTRIGYLFQGWATSATATEATIADEAAGVTDPTYNGRTYRLYAVWAECPHENTTTTTVDPTCTEEGSVTVTCDDCGATVSTETTPATDHDYTYTDNGEDHTVGCSNGCGYSVTEDHTYVDGSCVCGAEEVVVPAEPTEVTVKVSHTVSFDSDLQMNYRIKLEDILVAVPNYVTDGAYLTVEKDRYPMGGGAMTVETVTLYPDLTTDAERMLFNLAGIQSVEMGSELRAVLHFFDAEDNEYCTTVDTYSVLAYAELCFDYYDPAEDAYLFTMLIDCLNYGAAAQVAFDRRADEPVNAGLEAYQQYASTELSEELTDVRTYVDNDRSITAVTKMGFTVTFADKTEINAKLTVAEGYTKADITSVKVLNENGEEVAVLTEFTELDDGRLQVTFTGMKSVDMRNMFYFVAYVGDQVASQNVGYSIEAYAKSNIASTDANAANLAKACIYYGDSAKIYFDSLLG